MFVRFRWQDVPSNYVLILLNTEFRQSASAAAYATADTGHRVCTHQITALFCAK